MSRLSIITMTDTIVQRNAARDIAALDANEYVENYEEALMLVLDEAGY